MGCDIHVHVEARSGMPTSQPTWRTLPPANHDAQFDFDYWYSGRDYFLFGILAGVRVDDLPMIDNPRGLPADVSTALREEAESWGSDGHTHSWFTVQEMFAYDWWGQTHTAEAMVYDEPGRNDAKSVQEYATRTGRLPLWATQRWNSPDNADPNKWVTISWPTSYAERCDDWIHFMDQLAHIACTEYAGDLTAIRTVFWFDN